MRRVWLVILTLMIVGLFVWQRLMPKPTAPAALAQKWHQQAYGLDEGEVMRFTSPPSARPYHGSRLHWVVDGQTPAPYYNSDGERNAFWYVWIMGRLRPIDAEIAPQLMRLSASGDWVVRPVAADERKLRVCASLVGQVNGVDIAVERKLVKRDVLVAKGKWLFKPLDATSKPDVVQFTPETKGDSFNSGDWPEFVQLVEWMADLKVVDETGEPPKQISWSWRSNAGPAENPAELKSLSANLEKQTSITFVKEKRPVWMWLVSERGATTRPGGQ